MCASLRGRGSVIILLGLFILELVQAFPWIGLGKDCVCKEGTRTLNAFMENRQESDTATTTVESSFSSENTLINKQLLCVRHGISEANEMMSRPGNQWGEPTFRDDPSLLDARLSETGKIRTQQDLPRQLRQQENLKSFIQEQGVEMVLISPLTRCLQTYMYGVEPVLKECIPDFEAKVPVLAIPLLRERVYTASDTGRPSSILKEEFPSVNFDACEQHHDRWWYGGNLDDSTSLPEWRPFGQGQWYAVPGEPEDVFDQRIRDLDEWLSQRKEKRILIVSHWGVFRHLTNGTEWNNAEAKLLLWTYCSKHKTRTVSHHGNDSA
jgi:broad specificity phosphatase PhoE